jgi:hypothetical protein
MQNKYNEVAKQQPNIADSPKDSDNSNFEPIIKKDIPMSETSAIETPKNPEIPISSGNSIDSNLKEFISVMSL